MSSRIIALQIALMLLTTGVAQAQDDLAILSASVPPKVVLLLDTSGSMQFVINHDDFNDPNVRWQFHDRAPLRLYDDDDGFQCSFGTVPEASSTTGLCPGSQHGSGDDRCPNTDSFGTRVSGGVERWCHNISTGCTFAPDTWACRVSGSYTYLTPPDYGPNYSTDYQRNYLHWVAQNMHAGVKLDLPTSDRMSSAKEAITNLMDGINPDGFTDAVHFGLARFQSSSNGGYVLVAPDPNSKPIINARLSDTSTTGYTSTFPNGGTPLSESLVDIGRYYVGSSLLGSYSAYNRTDYSGSVPSSPWDATCRDAFVIVMTDGAPTNDLNDHHGTDFTTTIGNADGDTNENPDAWSGRTPTNYVLPYDTSSGSDWLDDVAYYLSNNDLIPDATLDEEQTIVTYAVGFTIDHPLLEETGTNGKGDYFTTSNAAELQEQLEAALTSIIERSSSLTSATVPASRSAFGDGFYSANFTPSTSNPFWEGHLEAYRLSPDLEVLDASNNPALDPNTNLFIEPRNYYWDAGEELAASGHPARNLYTVQGGARVSFDESNISETDLGLVSADLTAYPNDPAVPFANLGALADAIVAYMRGEDAFDDNRDTDVTEKRTAVLGDIFHSNPLAIGPPPSALSSEDGYGPLSQSGTFLNLYETRRRKIFVGANDGFLHAFNGGIKHNGDNPLTGDPNNPEIEEGYYDLGSGQELFAWVPSFLLDSVKMIPRNLPRTNYYVDGSPAAADVWIPSSASDTTKEGDEWTTLLITGMRQGGAGYLALDVTDPNATSGTHGPYPKFQWEFSSATANLGDTWSEPVITRVKMVGNSGTGDLCGDVTTDDGDCIEKWVVIVGGGFDETTDPNLSSYTDDPNDSAFTLASKAVYILDAADGSVLAKLEYDATDTTLSRMKYGIPSSPGVLDLDFDGLADVIYIGDLGGQVWKWDIHLPGEDTDSDGFVESTIWPAGVFFASDPASIGSGNFHYHSIFFAPIASFLDGDLVLAFASGERTDLSYEGSASYDDNNRFWVVKDLQPIGSSAFDIELFEDYQTISGQVRGINDISSETVDPNPDDDGYYIVVPDGEKFIVNHIVFGGLVLALSYVPDNAPTNVCNALGYTNLYGFGVGDGSGGLGGSGSPVRTVKLGNGAPTDPRVSVSEDSNGDTIVQLVGQTSLGEVGTVALDGGGLEQFKRTYWRQRF